MVLPGLFVVGVGTSMFVQWMLHEEPVAWNPDPLPAVEVRHTVYQPTSDTVEIPAERRRFVVTVAANGSTAMPPAGAASTMESEPDAGGAQTQEPSSEASESPEVAAQEGGQSTPSPTLEAFTSAPEEHVLAWMRYCDPGKMVYEADQQIIESYDQPPVWVKERSELPAIVAASLNGCAERE